VLLGDVLLTQGMHARCQVIASTDPKPVPGDWLGNGAPIKFSTRETREEGKGWFVIQEQLRRLQHVRAAACSACPACHLAALRPACFSTLAS
jgi:hypothetical protein